MSPNDDLKKTFELIRMERLADQEQYRQKVLMLPLQRRTQEGKCWYPVQVRRHYIGTGERLILEIERTKHLDQPHVFQSGKVVSIFSNAGNQSDKQNTGGVINYVRDNVMVITLNHDDLPDWIDDGQLGVDVMFDEMTYREMEFALKEVMKAENSRTAELKEIMLGYSSPAFKPTEQHRFLSASLNESQSSALKKIISAKDVAIIHGPPGTGKTTTLVQAIVHTVTEEGQVLVCAPSNAAVDLLVDKLSEKGLNVLRIGHPARVTEQTLSKTLDARIAMHEHYKELRSLRKKMEQLRNTAHKYKRKFGYAEKQERRLLLQEAKAMKADADVLEFYITNDLFQSSDVIACTLVGSSHPVLRGKRWKSVFIDEAAQALEPACWIPVLRSERIILAGDHQQLPPTIKSFEAAKAGLAVTLFEKCIAAHPESAVMLQTQYRMHEDIMRFSARYFYKDKLIADESVRTSTLRDEIPAMNFIDTAGCGFAEKQDPETLSRINEEEASLLIKEIERLVRSVTVEDWNFTLGIITPYSAQVDYLVKLAESSEELSAIAKHITINTVDAFQGQERDVIAISFVRSNEKGEVGFLADIRRTNVAITRAKKHVMMVGDSATLGSHPFYLELVEYVQQKGYYKSAWELIV